MNVFAELAWQKWNKTCAVDDQLRQLKELWRRQDSPEVKVQTLVTQAYQLQQLEQAWQRLPRITSFALCAFLLQMPSEDLSMKAILIRHMRQESLRRILLQAVAPSALELTACDPAMQSLPLHFFWERMLFKQRTQPQSNSVVRSILFVWEAPIGRHSDAVREQEQLDNFFCLAANACGIEIDVFLKINYAKASKADKERSAVFIQNVLKCADLTQRFRKAGWRRSSLQSGCNAMHATHNWLKSLLVEVHFSLTAGWHTILTIQSNSFRY